MRRFSPFLGTLILSLLFVAGTSVVNASTVFHTGSALSVAYGATGIWAEISVPPVPPPMYGSSASSQSSWVASTANIWIQTGWLYYKDWTDPEKYVEYCVNDGTGQCPWPAYYHMDLYPFSPTWNTSDEYMTEYDPSIQQWCAWFGVPLVRKTCINTNYYQAVEVQAFTEIQEDARNEVSTHFANVKYKASNLSWYAFSSNTFYSENPYAVFVISPDNFWTYRMAHQVYLPLVEK